MNIRKLLLNIFEKVLIKSDYFPDVKHTPTIVVFKKKWIKRFYFHIKNDGFYQKLIPNFLMFVCTVQLYRTMHMNSSRKMDHILYPIRQYMRIRILYHTYPSV